MLSRAADALPGGEGWQFEPKWDGFRTLVFRDADEILLQSRDEKPMNRYFPELIAPLAATLSERCVVDGEIVIVGVGGLDFGALLVPAEAGDHAVSRALVLHRDHRAFPGAIGCLETLCPDTIEPSALEAVEPVRRKRSIARRR